MQNWILPDEASLMQEYHVEVVLKGNAYFDSIEEFEAACEDAEVIDVDNALDSKIAYRSRTSSHTQLLNLIKSYRSYPEFRNEKTLQNLYDRISLGETMTMPLVLEFADGSLRVLAGNTRADVAMQLHGSYKALKIKVA
jgi:hypothetical protein